jgi:hypothetical protein
LKVRDPFIVVLPSMLTHVLISFLSQLLLRLTASARRGEYDIVARLLDFWRAFVVDSMVSDLFSFIFFVLSALAHRVLTTFPFHVAALGAGLACAALEYLAEEAVAPSATTTPARIEDGRKIPGCEKDDATPSSNPGRSLRTATLPASTSANSRRRPHVVE